MKRWCTTKGFQLKERLLTTMLLKPKLNTFPRKLNKLSSNTSPSKEPGKEFSIFLLKLKLFTIQKGKNMLPDKVENTFKLDTSTKTKLTIKLPPSPPSSTSPEPCPITSPVEEELPPMSRVEVAPEPTPITLSTSLSLLPMLRTMLRGEVESEPQLAT